MSSLLPFQSQSQSKDDKAKDTLLSPRGPKATIAYFTLFGKQRIHLIKNKKIAPFVTLFIILIVTILFDYFYFFFDSRFYSSLGLISSIITCLISIWFLFDVSTTSPGYQEEPTMTMNEFTASPLVQTIKSREFTLKYCETCCIKRDIRTFHCSMCNMCIMRHDHHCGYISNCVGKNNTHLFFLFITAVWVLSVILSGFTIDYLYLILSNQVLTSKTLMVPLVLIGLISVTVFISLASGVIRYIIMFSYNQTQNEQIRVKYDNKVFDNGCKSNWNEVWCIDKAMPTLSLTD